MGKIYSEQRKSSRKEAADALRKAADMIEQGSVSYPGAEQISVGEHVHLEIEFEAHEDHEEAYELELEIKWKS